MCAGKGSPLWEEKVRAASGNAQGCGRRRRHVAQAAATQVNANHFSAFIPSKGLSVLMVNKKQKAYLIAEHSYTA